MLIPFLFPFLVLVLLWKCRSSVKWIFTKYCFPHVRVIVWDWLSPAKNMGGKWLRVWAVASLGPSQNLCAVWNSVWWSLRRIDVAVLFSHWILSFLEKLHCSFGTLPLVLAGEERCLRWGSWGEVGSWSVRGALSGGNPWGICWGSQQAAVWGRRSPVALSWGAEDGHGTAELLTSGVSSSVLPPLSSQDMGSSLQVLPLGSLLVFN